MNSNMVLNSVACVIAILMAGCNTIPEKPSFTPSKEYDGKYHGTRTDESMNHICKPTGIVGTVVDGEARLKLTYNGTNLVGWITEAGDLKLYNDNPRWDYKFTGKASESKIEGVWTTGNAPCRGTWSVQQI